jgi:hypothetical protein
MDAAMRSDVLPSVVERRAGLVNVRRSVSSGVVRELGKTERSRRQVPLSSRAIAALDGRTRSPPA